MRAMKTKKAGTKPGPEAAARSLKRLGAGGSSGVQQPGVEPLVDLATRANASPHVHQLAALRDVLNPGQPVTEEPVQREATAPSPNRTGMPDRLKGGLEQLSGFDLSDVRVHYNSSKPAQLNAHAYTQGRNIHVAPGQERHVPHEGWHAVQQMQDRVRATTQLHSTPINDESHLEREADVMGAQALRTSDAVQLRVADSPEVDRVSPGTAEPVAQRKVGFEFQTSWNIVPDPVGPLEGLASSVGQQGSEVLGGDREGSSVLGFLTGRAVRGVFDLGTSLTRGIGTLLGGGLSLLGGGGIRDRIQGGIDRTREVAPLAIVKGIPLLNGLGWDMTNDGGEMEFATVPFAETDVDTARMVMNDLTAFTGQLVALSGRYRLIPLVWFDNSTVLGMVAAIVPGAPEMPAVPQLTAGIDLAKITGAFAQMGTPNTQANQRFTRNRGATLGAVANNLPNRLQNDSAAYRGIVTLMATYVAQSAVVPGVKTEKDITPVMARTNLGVALARTPERQNADGNNLALAQLKTKLETDVIDTATAATANSRRMIPINADFRLFPQKFGSGLDPEELASRSGPSIRQWAEGVVDGVDRTSVGGFLERVTARSMGAFQFTEDVGPNDQPGIIVEFRDLPRDLPRDQWTQWVVTMMQAIATFNQ